MNDGIDRSAEDFYRHVLLSLNEAGVPYMIGGAYAFNCFTGIVRYTKDLDIFIRRSDYEKTAQALQAIGYRTELTFPHWLAKAFNGDSFVDIIFDSGNGVARVDDIWIEHALQCEVMGVKALIAPVEETIWSKAFIMERERYDGADIAHLIRACGEHMDWQRLRDRFGEHWRVLLSHLILFGFIYPAQRDLAPDWLMDELLEKLQQERHASPSHPEVCQGPILSREQYLVDIEQWGYRDARLAPLGNMKPADAAIWTAAIKKKDERL
jgi:hypothetical protein